MNLFTVYVAGSAESLMPGIITLRGLVKSEELDEYPPVNYCFNYLLLI